MSFFERNKTKNVFERIKEMTEAENYVFKYTKFIIEKEHYFDDWYKEKIYRYKVIYHPLGFSEIRPTIVKELSRSRIDIFEGNPGELHDLIASTIREILEEEANEIESEFRKGVMW